MKPYKVVGNVPLNLDCGAELLNRYQVIWKELYDEAEVQGKRVHSANYLLNSVVSKFTTEQQNVKKFENAVEGFAHILQDIGDVIKNVAMLEKEFEDIEVNLLELENLCKEQELQRNKTVELLKLENYKQQKEVEFERYKLQLEKEKLKKDVEAEKLQSVKAQERQSTFEEAFTQDVDFYKSHGHPERPVVISSETKKVDLAEIEIEQDPEALDDFLKSTIDQENDETESKKVEASSEDIGACKERETNENVEMISPVVNDTKEKQVEASSVVYTNEANKVKTTSQDDDKDNGVETPPDGDDSKDNRVESFNKEVEPSLIENDTKENSVEITQVDSDVK